MSEFNISRTPLLLITDHRSTKDRLDNFLTEFGFDVKVTPCDDLCETTISGGHFHLIVLDCDSCADNGMALQNKIKGRCPVLMISSRNDEYSVATALDRGADDYMAKPIRQWELLARIRNILRRSEPAPALLCHGGITVDTVKGVVSRHGEEIYLSALEYRILLIFLANKDRVLTRQQLLDEIWNIGGDYVNDNTLTVYIKRIREKIEDNPATPQLIKTVRGKGYKAGN